MSETADAFDPAPAAVMLADAWRRGTLLAELPEAIRPRTMTQAYVPPAVLRRLSEADAASAAGGSRSARMALGGLKQCRSMSQTAFLDGVEGPSPRWILLEGGRLCSGDQDGCGRRSGW